MCAHTFQGTHSKQPVLEGVPHDGEIQSNTPQEPRSSIKVNVRTPAELRRAQGGNLRLSLLPKEHLSV